MVTQKKSPIGNIGKLTIKNQLKRKRFLDVLYTCLINEQ